jgi:hypothetical protein
MAARATETPVAPTEPVKELSPGLAPLKHSSQTSSHVYVCGPITRVGVTDWLDESEKEITGQTLQVSLEGGWSFRINEGEQMYAAFDKYIRAGWMCEFIAGSVKTSTSTKDNETDTGSTYQTKTDYHNCSAVRILQMIPPEVPEVIRNLEEIMKAAGIDIPAPLRHVSKVSTYGKGKPAATGPGTMDRSSLTPVNAAVAAPPG